MPRLKWWETHLAPLDACSCRRVLRDAWWLLALASVAVAACVQLLWAPLPPLPPAAAAGLTLVQVRVWCLGSLRV